MTASGQRPRVSFLVPDIAGPVLGPVTVLAGHLADGFDVEIVGPDFGRGVCPMYRGAFDYKVVPCPRLYRLPDYLWEREKLIRALSGDVVVAVKAYADTLPVALARKRRTGCRVAVYLDEWDGALYYREPRARRAGLWLRHWHHPLEEPYHPLVERLIPRADVVLSTSTFLQRRFGGHVVPMGVDTEVFKPRPPDETARLRREHGLEGRRLIVFGGVVRPHKGIEQILEALNLLGDSNIRFVIVGPVNVHVEALRAHPRWSPFVVALGPRPKEQMPAYLGLADLVILPLDRTPLAQSQVPCKIFEAMAMGKPIIASAVSDLPDILEGCGWVVPPGDAQALSAAIRDVFSNSGAAAGRAAAARDKCARMYSREQTRRQLTSILQSLVKRE